MMNTSQPQLNQLSDSDLELLSAYLDNQLSVSERVGLERRLTSEPYLRAELEDLRATTTILRDLEPLRPPRSFTLDPASAPRRARVFPWAWATQLGSGLAGMLLVLLASAQILLGQSAAPVFSSLGSDSADSAAAPAAAGQPEASMMMATEAPAATVAPMAAQAAPTAAPAAPMAVPAGESVPNETAGDQAANQPPPPFGGGSAGGVAGMGGPPSIDATVDAMRRDGTETTQAVPSSASPTQPGPDPRPGLTLALGLALLALAAGSYLYGRRRV